MTEAGETEPRYETARELTERTGKTDTVVCTECGVFVMNVVAHTGFHVQVAAVLAEARERPEPVTETS